MPFTCGSQNFYSILTEGGPLTCDQINQNFQGLVALAQAFCTPKAVYFKDHASDTLIIPDGDLPISKPERIEVEFNGSRIYNEALSGFDAGSGYLITDAGTITTQFTPSGNPKYSNLVVRYWPDL